MYWCIILLAASLSLPRGHSFAGGKFLSIYVGTYSCFVPDIINFSQDPNGTLAPDTMVTFNCQAIGSDVTWYINDNRTDKNDSHYTIYHEMMTPSNWNITLTTIASEDKNNTDIKCHSSGEIGGQFEEEALHLILAGNNSNVTSNSENFNYRSSIRTKCDLKGY